MIADTSSDRTRFCVDFSVERRREMAASLGAAASCTHFCGAFVEGEGKKAYPILRSALTRISGWKISAPQHRAYPFLRAVVMLSGAAGRAADAALEPAHSPATRTLRTHFCDDDAESAVKSGVWRTYFCERKASEAYPFLRCAPQCAAVMNGTSQGRTRFCGRNLSAD